MTRVTVRINQTAAGVGDVGQVLDVDDTTFLRALTRNGVVTILSEPASSAGPNLQPHPAGDVVTSIDDTASSEDGTGEAAPRKPRRRKTNGATDQRGE